MNHSEFLRRKVAAMPKVLGPTVPGDASETTRIRSYRAAASAGRGTIRDPLPACCGKKGTDVSSVPPDQTQEFRTLRAAGCAVGCVARPATILQPCTPQDWTPEVPRDASGNRLDPITTKSLAYKSAEPVCPSCQHFGFPSDVRSQCC